MICCHWDCRRYCREVSPHVETHRLHNVLVRSMAVQTSFIPPSSFSPIGQHGHNRNIFFPFMCSSQLFLRMYLSEVSISLQYLNKWLLQHILHRPHWEIPHKSFRWCDTQLPVCLEELASEKKNMLLPVLGWQYHFCTIFWKQSGCWLWSIKFWTSSIWENTFLLIQCSWNWEQLQNFRSQHSYMDIKRHSRWRILCLKQQFYLWAHEMWIICCHIKQ